jgi:hypothetical protein
LERRDYGEIGVYDEQHEGKRGMLWKHRI